MRRRKSEAQGLNIFWLWACSVLAGPSQFPWPRYTFLAPGRVPWPQPISLGPNKNPVALCSFAGPGESCWPQQALTRALQLHRGHPIFEWPHQKLMLVWVYPILGLLGSPTQFLSLGHINFRWGPHDSLAPLPLLGPNQVQQGQCLPIKKYNRLRGCCWPLKSFQATIEVARP